MSGGRKLAYLVATAMLISSPNYSMPEDALAADANAMTQPASGTLIQSPKKNLELILKDGPCKEYPAERTIEIKSSDIQKIIEKYNSGDPMIYALSRVFADADTNSCYFVKNSSLTMFKETYGSPEKVTCDKGEIFYTNIPFEKMEFIDARVENRKIHVTGRYAVLTDNLLFTIPKNFRISLDITDIGNDDYFIKFNQSEDTKPKISINLVGRMFVPIRMKKGSIVSAKDKSENMQEIHHLIDSLITKGSIDADKKEQIIDIKTGQI